MKTYAGAGIIPIIIHNNKPYFVMFMLNKGTLTDAGGKVEDNTSVLDTATRELYEESAGLFNINSSILDKNSMYLDTIYKDNLYYRVYFVIFNNFNITDTKYYYDNLKKIKEEKFNPFSETRNICLMSFDYIHFVKDNGNNIILMNDHLNQVLELSPRTTRIIKTIYNNFKDQYNFFDKLLKKINKITLKKLKKTVKSYTYNDYHKITIKDLDTFCNI